MHVEEGKVKNGAYCLVVAPVDYPGKKYRGRYAYAHRVNYWRFTGKLPEHVHHKNKDRFDNDVSNLEGVDKETHSKIHALEKKVTYIELVCAHCGNKFLRPANLYRHKMKSGQSRFFCCRSHQVKQMWIDGSVFGGRYHNRS